MRLHFHASVSVFCALAFLAVGGCGAGAEVTPPASPAPVVPQGPDPWSVHIYSTAALDGVVRSDGTFDTSAVVPFVGDADSVTNGLAGRQFYSFDLTQIPAGMTLERAEFCAYQIGGSGTPYNTHGPTEFEHVDFGAALEGSDYDVPLLVRLGGFSNVPNPGTAGVSGRCLAVLTAVQATLDAGRTTFQVRLRCQTVDSDLDGVADYSIWVDSEQTATGSSAIERPILRVWYRAGP